MGMIIIMMNVETMTELAIFAAVGMGLYFLIKGIGPGPNPPVTVTVWPVNGADDFYPVPGNTQISFFNALHQKGGGYLVLNKTTGPDGNGYSYSTFSFDVADFSIAACPDVDYINNQWLWARKVLVMDSATSWPPDVENAFLSALAGKTLWSPKLPTQKLWNGYNWFMMGDTQVLYPIT
jgi:hypothetical protein